MGRKCKKCDKVLVNRHALYCRDCEKGVMDRHIKKVIDEFRKDPNRILPTKVTCPVCHEEIKRLPDLFDHFECFVFPVDTPPEQEAIIKGVKTKVYLAQDTWPLLYELRRWREFKTDKTTLKEMRDQWKNNKGMCGTADIYIGHLEQYVQQLEDRLKNTPSQRQAKAKMAHLKLLSEAAKEAGNVAASRRLRGEIAVADWFMGGFKRKK